MLARMNRTARLWRLPLTAAGAALALGSSATPAAAATTSVTSSNWAGYVARAPAGARFTSVSGSWTEPAALCTPGREAFSAVWVGLGGYRGSATALEQAGTDANCTAAGQARYSSWIELLPAAPTTLHVTTRPGDRITASVTVRGTHVTLRLRNLTSGESYSATRQPSSVDVSSADWIVEAPSLCSTRACRTLALADFSRVDFSAATATSAGRTAAVTSGGWPVTGLSLRQGAEAAGPARLGSGGGAALISAIPSAVRGAGAFSVQFAERSGPGEGSEAPALPSGGPPGG